MSRSLFSILKWLKIILEHVRMHHDTLFFGKALCYKPEGLGFYSQ
jgi:hypothetical protein